MISRKLNADTKLLLSEDEEEGIKREKIQVRHYPLSYAVRRIASVSGAGDCLAAGIIAGMLNGLAEKHCVSVGFAAAEASLRSTSAVPLEFFHENHECWNEVANYKVVL